MEVNSYDECVNELNQVSADIRDLQALNKDYLNTLEQVVELQEKCMKQISHQRYRLAVLSKSMKKLPPSAPSESVEKLKSNLWKRRENLADIEQTLPKENGRYLKIILGNVNVSILNKNDKFRYKDEYEKFKLVLSIIGLILSALNLLVHSRALELVFMFLLVWYYCTLTIRESILKVNGSRIKGWWRTHHFISTVCSGVLLIWPNSVTWHLFRPQFMIFNVYISVVQALQFWYQQGVLYRLKALGERHNMDITIEGN
uniref:Transmembrane protein 120 homolog n=1 Tax=Cacopsylla melanoneura TaxID=428564 RepID=A0A8D9B3M7_9HEMI